MRKFKTLIRNIQKDDDGFAETYFSSILLICFLIMFIGVINGFDMWFLKLFISFCLIYIIARFIILGTIYIVKYIYKKGF